MNQHNKTLQIGIYASIVLAFILWYLVFVIKPFNFWLTMSINTLLLIFIASYFNRGIIRSDEIHVRNIVIGIGAAVCLYMIFWTGNRVLIFLSTHVSGFLPDRTGDLEAIYANRESLSSLLVAALLFFPIGFGEELYWRGFVQRYFMEKWNATTGMIITTCIYTLVHIPTGNPVLIIAAFTCGIFWGYLYMKTGSIVPVLISHMLWDPMIFVFFPVR
jgi:membrane protease YdiL (CAAX protease family)